MVRNDKNTQQEIIKAIRAFAKKCGYKTHTSSIFMKKGDLFVHCDYLILKENLMYRLYIKHYEYDSLFWEIMQMEENQEKSDSLRAVGAFRAPSVPLRSGSISLVYPTEEIATSLFSIIEETSNEFVKEHQIDEYVLSHVEELDEVVLQCLALLHMGMKQEAMEIAFAAIEQDDYDSYSNKGKTFLEWLLSSELTGGV